MMPVLLLVDVQRNMLEPPTPVPAARTVSAAIADLLAQARAERAPVVHIRNNGPTGYPDEAGTPGWELIHDVLPGEHVIDKEDWDAFVNTPLADLVPPSAAVVVVGMQSEFCVRETSLSALRRGHPVTLVRGAHATYDDSEPADMISKRTEDELAAAGVCVVDRDAVTFRGLTAG